MICGVDQIKHRTTWFIPVMSFLDPYDIARSTTPTPAQPQQPTLDEEVNQVIGQLGSWWGGFRKQVLDCNLMPFFDLNPLSIESNSA